MASDDVVDPVPASDAAEAKHDDKPAKASKEKKPKVTKKPRAPKGSKPAAAHPAYLQMICEAISALKERSGSSQPAIAKFVEDKYKTGLPPNFKKLLSVQLKKCCQKGKLVQVKHSYKLSDSLKKNPALKVVKPGTPGKKSKAGRPKGSKNKVAKSPKVKVGRSVGRPPKVTKPAKPKASKVVKRKAPMVPKVSKAVKAPVEKKAPAPKKAATVKKVAPPKKKPAPKKSVTPKKVPPKKVKPVKAKAKKTPVAKKAKV